jgi:hypothetical protein
METAQSKLQRLNDEISFLGKLSKVFGTAEGKEVLDWILNKCYLHTPADSERAQGLQDWALELLRTVNKANVEISKSLLERWHLDYQHLNIKKRKRLQEQIKEEKES